MIRIIPNGAFESFIALSIGCIIALAFDFLIKSLRAKFIDVASKRADLEISRRLFDRILTLTPNEQTAKTGAMAGTIREFETLREFFNSSTLVILIDLPFVFFFYIRNLSYCWAIGLCTTCSRTISNDCGTRDTTIFSTNNKRFR